MSEKNVLIFDKKAINTLKQNKDFFIQVFIQNYFIGFIKFLEISLSIFFFINLYQNEITFNFDIKQNYVYLFIIFSFVLKYLSQEIFKLFNYNNPKINRVGIFFSIFWNIYFINNL
ncbi:hypothetical protein [Spiroplasma taiwanense]|uniref:hypothetical protein n=1 Tax=Spiroplasma taiwanense TaxID=2145 RepID=UPI00035A33E4|nr:hypothetical protein [Spiroplasma taiwanense]